MSYPDLSESQKQKADGGTLGARGRMDLESRFCKTRGSWRWMAVGLPNSVSGFHYSTPHFKVVTMINFICSPPLFLKIKNPPILSLQLAILSKLITLSIHRHDLFLGRFLSLQEAPSARLLPPPAPGNRQSAFWLCGRTFLETSSRWHPVYSSVLSSFAHQCVRSSSIVWHVLELPPVLLLDSIHSPVTRHSAGL